MGVHLCCFPRTTGFASQQLCIAMNVRRLRLHCLVSPRMVDGSQLAAPPHHEGRAAAACRAHTNLPDGALVPLLAPPTAARRHDHATASVGWRRGGGGPVRDCGVYRGFTPAVIDSRMRAGSSGCRWLERNPLREGSDVEQLGGRHSGVAGGGDGGTAHRGRRPCRYTAFSASTLPVRDA
jgi:hypothetical protein